MLPLVERSGGRAGADLVDRQGGQRLAPVETFERFWPADVESWQREPNRLRELVRDVRARPALHLLRMGWDGRRAQHADQQQRAFEAVCAGVPVHEAGNWRTACKILDLAQQVSAPDHAPGVAQP